MQVVLDFGNTHNAIRRARLKRRAGMRKPLCVWLCIILIILTGCGNRREIEQPRDVREIST